MTPPESGRPNWTPSYGPEPTAEDTRTEADVCVIGSGASGAVVAATLSRAGLDVVVVEQGPFIEPDTDPDDVLATAELAWVLQDNGLWAKIGWPWSTCNVGGGTVFYGGVSLRHRTVDFDAEQRLGSGEMLMRWPWSPADLEPYYTAAEHLIGVSGGTGDPSLPPGHRYPMPPVPQSPGGRTISTAARSLGLTPFPTPLAIASQPYQGRAACSGDQACISSQCVTGAKADVYALLLRPLIEAGRLRLRAGLKAVRLVPDGPHRVRGVECVRVDSGRRYVIPARQVVIAGNAIQSAALLLRSAGPEWPNGLGNEQDLVGRGLCMKVSEYVFGYRRVPSAERPAHPPGRRAGPGPFSTVALTDYYVDDEAPGGLGGLIYEAGDEQTFPMRSDEQVLRLECLVPDEPRLDNRVTLGRGQDQFGLADVVLNYHAAPREMARLEYLLRRGEDILRAAGCTLMRRQESLWYLGSTHLHGTCRAGTDPRTSVTDPDGRVHSVENVTVVDGALLPFPGAVNPTLTIQSLALRCAHRLLSRAFGRALPDSVPAFSGLQPAPPVSVSGRS